jgi:hypothetical protein
MFNDVITLVTSPKRLMTLPGIGWKIRSLSWVKNMKEYEENMKKYEKT